MKRYVALIEVAKNSRCVQAGFLHNEQAGVVAVDQKGGGPNLAETRLYTYADDDSKVIYLIAIGDKSSQHSDVEYGRIFANSLKSDEQPQEKQKNTGK